MIGIICKQYLNEVKNVRKMILKIVVVLKEFERICERNNRVNGFITAFVTRSVPFLRTLINHGYHGPKRAITNRSNNLQDWTRTFYLETERLTYQRREPDLFSLPPSTPLRNHPVLSCPVPFPWIKERTGGDNQRFLHDLYIPDGTFFSSLVRENVLHGPWSPCNFSISTKPVVSSSTTLRHTPRVGSTVDVEILYPTTPPPPCSARESNWIS